MSFPELDFGFLEVGEPGFHDHVFGFVDGQDLVPYNNGSSMEVVRSQSSTAETRFCLDHLDFVSEEPYIFGEPLNPATNFAWDLPEARFRKEVQMMRESANNLSSNNSASSIPFPELPLEQQMPVHTLRVNVLASESNPNSKARLGPKDLQEIGKETMMHPGQGVAPEFMKRSSLGAFGPVVTKVRKKRKSEAGTSTAGGGADGVFNYHGRVNSQKDRTLTIEDNHDATHLGSLKMDVVLE